MNDKDRTPADVPVQRSLTATVVGSVAGGVAGAVASQVTGHLLDGRKPQQQNAPPKKST